MAEDFDLSSVISPGRALDPDYNPADPTQKAALFAKLQGGGVGMPSADNPTAPATTPATTAPVSVSRPNRAPAAVTPSGTPQGETVGEQAIRRSLEEMSALPSTADELAQEQALEQKRTADAAKLAQNLRDPATGKMDPQYRPSVGQRIWRGARGALEGLAFGGIPGAIRGAVAPQIYPGDKAYGAPNEAGQQELRREQEAVASDDQSLTEKARRFKEAREAATGKSAEDRAIAAEYRANRPPIEGKKEVVDAQGRVHYLTGQEIEAGKYQSPTTYNAENKPDKTPTNYEQTVIAAQSEADPNGPLHRAAKEMIDTEKKKFAAANPGRQPTDIELWAQAFKTEYGRAPNAEEISSRKVAGGGTAGGAAARPTNVPNRVKSVDAFENHWQKTYFQPLENKYNTQRKSVEADKDLKDTEKQAEYNRIEAERTVEKQKVQDAKDAEAEKYQVYNQPPAGPAAPAAVTPSGTPQAAAPQRQPPPQAKPVKGQDLGVAPKGSKEGRTGKLNGAPVIVKGGRIVAQ